MIDLVKIMGYAFVIGLSGALMPGPLFAVAVKEATRRGAWAGPLLIVGHMVLEMVAVVAIALGFARFLNTDLTFILISLLGGAALCWMGIGMLRSAKHLKLEWGDSDPGGLHPILAGAVVSVSNPYWSLWWATAGAACVVSGLEKGALGVLFFFVGHILSDFAWYTLVSVGVARGRSILSDRAYRGLIMACGVFLIGFGAWFVELGVKKMNSAMTERSGLEEKMALPEGLLH